MEISDWRDEIDRLDEELVRLLNRRSYCALEIGRIKRELNLPIYSPNREAEVIRHVLSLNEGPLDAGAVRRLFERIIDESRSLERTVVEREMEEDRSRKAGNDGQRSEDREEEG